MKRTKKVESVMSKLEAVKLVFEDLRDDLQGKFDNKSEKWQEGENGQQMESDIDSIDQIVSDLENVYSKVENLYEEE